MILASKVSSKGQVTIPKKVRQALKLKSGDFVRYEIDDGVVLLKRVEPLDLAFYTAVAETLEEWTSPEDDEAFRDL